MAFCHRKTLFTVVHFVLIILALLVTSQSGVDCRPLLLHYQWSWDHGLGLLLQSLPNGPAPGSTGNPTHP